MSFYIRIVTFFHEYPELNFHHRQIFWNNFLNWWIDECFESSNKTIIKNNIINLYKTLDLDCKWTKTQTKSEIHKFVFEKTQNNLQSYLIYSYFGLQFNKQVNYQQIYDNFLTLNSDEQISLISFCFDKMIRLIINFFNNWNEVVIDFILSYCIGIKVLINDQTISLISNFELSQFILKLNSLECLNYLNYDNWNFNDFKIKRDILVQIMNILPFASNKKHFFKLLKKYMNQK